MSPLAPLSAAAALTGAIAFAAPAGSTPPDTSPPDPAPGSAPAAPGYEPTIIEVDGRAVSFTCAGSGAPTVVLITGIGVPAESYGPVQAGLADHARVCAWDRPGYGASAPSDDDDDDDDNDEYELDELADDLDDVLEASGEPGPYVLVGHSFGGLIALDLAGESAEDVGEGEPGNVAGVVLLDASHPEMLDRFAEVPQIVALQDAEIDAARQEDPEAAAVREYDAIDESLRDAAEIGDLGDLPLLVVAHGLPLQEWVPAEALAAFDFDDAAIDAYEQIWRELQEDHATRSTNSTFVVAENSPHMLYLTEPELVVDSIVEFLAGLG